MKLEVQVKANADIVSNVLEVSNQYIDGLQKYRGCVATKETLKSDKEACAKIRAVKKAIADERIAFDNAVKAMPDVRMIHEALKSVEDECDAIVGPYWETVKAIVDADKAPEEQFKVTLELPCVTAKQLEKFKKALTKDGVAYQVQTMWNVNNK